MLPLLTPADIRKSTKHYLPVDTSVHKLKYHVSHYYGCEKDNNSFVDRGANSELAETNMRVIVMTDRSTDISGIDNHLMTGLKIVTREDAVPTQ